MPEEKNWLQNFVQRAVNVGNVIWGLGHSIIQGISREATSGYLWLKSQLTGKEEKLKPASPVGKWFWGEEELKPKSPVDIALDLTVRPTFRLGSKISMMLEQRKEPWKPEESKFPLLTKLIFGEEPIYPFEKELRMYREFAKKVVGEENIFSESLGTLAFLGFTSLDALPFFPEGKGTKILISKNIIKDIAKSQDKEAIKKLLLDNVVEFHHPKMLQRIDGLAEKLVKADKPSKVIKVLQNEIDDIAKKEGIDVKKIREEIREKLKAQADIGKEPPTPPKPPKNPPLDNIPYQPNFNLEKGVKMRRSFATFLRENPNFREKIESIINDLSVYYEPLKNKDIINQAIEELKQFSDIEEAYRKVGLRWIKVIPRDPGLAAKERVKAVILAETFWEMGDRVRALRLINTIFQEGTEYGRAVQVGRILPKISTAFYTVWAPKKLTNVVKEIAEKRGIKVKENFFEEVEAGLKNIFVNIQDEKLREERIKKFIEEFIAPNLKLTPGEMLDVYRYGNMLSGPVTHLRNFLGNFAQLITKNVFVMPVQAIIEFMKHPFNPALREIAFSDLPKIYKSTLGHLGIALETSLKILSEGGSPSSKFVDWIYKNEDYFETMINYYRYKKGMPLVFKPHQTILNFLEASDRFFSTLVAAGERARLTAKYERQGIKITEKIQREIDEMAQEVAETYLFRRPLGKNTETLSYLSQTFDYLSGTLYEAARRARESKNKALQYAGYGLSVLSPFVKTMSNIGITYVEFSPLGFLRPKSSFTSEKIAQALLGSILSGVGAYFAFNGRTTWLPPSDPKEKAIFYETRRPFSVNIGGKDIPMLYFGPFALAFAIPAALHWVLTERKPKWSPRMDEILYATALETVRFLMSNTPFQNINRFAAILSQEESFTPSNFLAGTLGQFIPLQQFLRTVARIVDPVYRKSNQDFWGPIKDSLPFIRQSLEAYENIGGEADYAWYSVFAPYKVGKESMPLTIALKELQIDRRRREAWNMYVKNQLKLEEIEKWVERGLWGFKTRELTEDDIKEGLQIMDALKTYEFKDPDNLRAALYFAASFLELLAQNHKDEEFYQAIEGLPLEYQEQIRDIIEERKEAQKLPFYLPPNLKNRPIKERAQLVYKLLKDLADRNRDEEFYEVVEILREKGILTEKVEKEIENLVLKQK